MRFVCGAPHALGDVRSAVLGESLCPIILLALSLVVTSFLSSLQIKSEDSGALH